MEATSGTVSISDSFRTAATLLIHKWGITLLSSRDRLKSPDSIKDPRSNCEAKLREVFISLSSRNE